MTDQEPEAKFQALKRYGRDLTQLARQGKIDPVVGRDELSEMFRTGPGVPRIIRYSSAIPVLTAIAEGLARKGNGDVPMNMRDKELIPLDLGALVVRAIRELRTAQAVLKEAAV